MRLYGQSKKKTTQLRNRYIGNSILGYCLNRVEDLIIHMLLKNFWRTAESRYLELGYRAAWFSGPRDHWSKLAEKNIGTR